MANVLYPKFKEQILQGGINLSTSDVKIVIVDTTGGTANYAYSAAHEFLTSVPADSRRGTSPNLTSKTFVDGVFDAADIDNAYPGLSGGNIEAAIMFVDTGVEATSRLIAFFDTGGSLPFAPTGNGANIIFNASGIFAL